MLKLFHFLQLLRKRSADIGSGPKKKYLFLRRDPKICSFLFGYPLKRVNKVTLLRKIKTDGRILSEIIYPVSSGFPSTLNSFTLLSQTGIRTENRNQKAIT